MDQARVSPDRQHSDELSPDEFTAAVSAVTSAFGDPTRRDIYLLAREAAPDGVTANEVAAHFGLHSNVARHHLEKLAAGGYLLVELVRQEAAGRPSKRYFAIAADNHLNFPPRRDDLLGTLLARAIEKLPIDEAHKLAEEVGYEYGRGIAARMEPGDGHRSAKAALASVADALTAHGFAAHTEARGGSLTLVAEHCPFGEAAKKYPHVLCAVDTGMIKGMLEGLYGETDPTIETSRPDGGEHCVTRV
ncbi:MAG: putative transcriptional regulator [Actinomycetia bacterium]|nr:putative transcriptional regulator [Actinomycetes bacterium]